MFKVLKGFSKPQSFQLGLSRPGRRREKLTVLAPRHFPLLAGTRNTGVQTIPSEDEPL
jgi:hypothetical protein